MKDLKHLRLLAALAALMMPAANAATVLAFNGTPATGSGQSARGDGPFTIGCSFTVTTTGLSITKLGAQDVDQPTATSGTNGFVGSPISVGLWSWDGSTAGSAVLLTTVTVASTDPQGAGGYRYATLGSAISLTNGGHYLIGAFVGASHEWFLDYAGGTSAYSDSAGTTDGITVNNANLFNGAAALAAPTSNGTSGTFRWGATNATVVPEPSAVLLGGLGGLGMLCLLRRRNRRD